MSGAEVISCGAANPDFGSHDAEPEQGMHGHPGSLLGFFPENKGKGLINLLKGAQEDAFQTPVINLYAVWDKGPVIDAEEEIYFTLNEAKRGDITEEELLNYAAAWDKELEGLTPGGYLKKGEDGENHTKFSVCDYDHRQFEALEHNAMITVMYRAADSIGNVTYKQSKVYIVDTASRRACHVTRLPLSNILPLSKDENNVNSSSDFFLTVKDFFKFHFWTLCPEVPPGSLPGRP